MDSDINKLETECKIIEKSVDQELKALDDYNWFKTGATRTKIVKVKKDGKGKQY